MKYRGSLPVLVIFCFASLVMGQITDEPNITISEKACGVTTACQENKVDLALEISDGACTAEESCSYNSADSVYISPDSCTVSHPLS